MPNISNKKKLGYASVLNDFTTALSLLAEQAQDRVSLSQAVFFLMAAREDMVGRPATFSELREAVGPSLRKSLHTTYKAFLAGPRKRSDSDKVSDGAGWLYQDPDPMDGRRKYLRLTEAGWDVMERVAISAGRNRNED